MKQSLQKNTHRSPGWPLALSVRQKGMSLAVALVSLLAATAQAANITKAGSGTDLTAPASWTGGVAPATNDVALWDTGSLGAGLTLNSGTPVWSGIAVTGNATDPIAIANGGSLTLGSSGIDMSAATINATVSSDLILSLGNQTWTIGTGRTFTQNTGAFTRSTGATLLIDKSVNTGTVAGNLSLVNSIVGPWLSIKSSGTAANNSANGYTFATVTGGNVVPFTTATAVTTGYPASSATANYDWSSTGTLGQIGSSRSANTIRFTGTAAVTQTVNSAQTETMNGLMNAGGGTVTLGGGSFAMSLQSGVGELLLAAMTSGITINGPIINNSTTPGAVTIVGPGSVTLAGAGTFTGNVNVNGKLIANLSRNSLNPTSSALGNPQSSRNINVNNGGTLQFIAGDSLGGANSTIVSTLVVNRGGVVTNNNNNFNTFGPIQLNGGTITGAGGAIAGYQMYNLRGNVTVGGSSMSTLAGTGAFSGYHLAAPTTFDVADVATGTDLLVSGTLVDRDQTDGGSGLLTKIGNGTMTLTGTNTYTGATFINAGTLALSGNGSIGNSLMISVGSGATFDVSGLSSTFTLGTGQWISNSVGTVNGSVNLAGPGASISPDLVGAPATLTFNNNLNLNAGGAVYFDLSTTAGSGNDKVVVGGNLTLSSSDTIHLYALSGSSVNLDESADYVLFQVSGSTTMTTKPNLVWDSQSLDYLHYSLVQSGNNVVLHYSAHLAPTLTGSADPASTVRNGAVTITATVTPGDGSITSVTADISQIGGSAAASLVLSNNNVYTNTFVVAAGTPVGTPSFTVSALDNNSLSGSSSPFSISIGAANEVWNGAGANDNWSSNPNWTGNTGPGFVGDSVTFAGTTRLTPNMDNNYSVTGVTFDGTAGSFVLGTAGSTLTNSGGIVNNSANAQTVNVPVAMSAGQTFNAASGNLILNSNIANGGFTLTIDGINNTAISGRISGGGGLTKTGNGTLTLTNINSFSGSLFVKAGTNVVDSGGAINTGGSYCSIGQDGSDIGTLLLKGTGTFTNTADFNIGDIGSSTGVVSIQDNAVLSCARLFIASANAAGSTAQGTLNQTGGALVETDGGIGTFVIGGRVSPTSVGVYNMSGGTLTAAGGIRVGSFGTGTFNVSGSAVITANGGFNIARITNSTGTLNLDGGLVTTFNITSSTGTNATNNLNGATVKPTAANAAWISNLSRCNVRNGGAIIDTTNLSVTILQGLVHSDNPSDNAIDGGLTKIGNGTLLLNGTNSYTGPTTIAAGTLGGTGIIGGAVTNSGTLAPGNNGIGTLTINGNLTLNSNSTNTFEVNGSTPTNDVVVLGASVAYGGVLNIVTNGGFTAGQQFVLFSGAGAATPGNFASIAGSPGSGLGFTFTNGVLSVVSTGPTGPVPITNSYSGGVLSLSWPAGQGWRLQVQTNSLSTGLSTNWSYLTDGSVNSTNITVDPTKPSVFYRLAYP